MIVFCAVRRACVASLRHRGWTVPTAVGAKEALNTRRAATIDLIFLDMLMPRVPGLQAMRVLKADGKTWAIPVLVLSNSSHERDVQEVMQWGAVGYLVKANLALQGLGNRVAQLLEESGRGRADEAHLAGRGRPLSS